jgi:hypothetical protein
VNLNICNVYKFSHIITSWGRQLLLYLGLQRWKHNISNSMVFFLVPKFCIFSTWKKTFLPPCPKSRPLFCPNQHHPTSLYKKEATLSINDRDGCQFVQCKRTTRCHLSKETSQVATVLLQALPCLQGFAELSCSVASPFLINSTTMLPPILTCSNIMSPQLV